MSQKATTIELFPLGRSPATDTASVKGSSTGKESAIGFPTTGYSSTGLEAELFSPGFLNSSVNSETADAKAKLDARAPFPSR